MISSPHLKRRIRRLPPPTLLALIYLSLIVIGTLVLKLPMSNHGDLSWGQAAFTSTSAVTVTGLTVVDTGTAFTGFGQAVIAVLIQVGGLGLMTFAVLVLTMLGMRLGMSQRVILREDLHQTSLDNLAKLARLVVKVALLCEAAGAVLLATVFVPEFGWKSGLWDALFHSISAFNNAGFSLFPDSLSRWVGSLTVNLMVPLLFLVGGLGFTVIGDLHEKRHWRKLMLHTKIMLAGTAVLTIGGWVMILALEWNNPGTLGPLPYAQRVLAAWFQAVTPRTAGFNTVDIAALHDSTSLVIVLLMAIGGGPASTAGGVKVTTFVVLLLSTIAFFRRTERPHIFGRSLGIEEVMKVLALTVVSTIVVMTALFAISVSHDGPLDDLAFEVVSAFGTVGLTRGATGSLDALGQTVLCVVMFLGRVGPLTLGFFLATRRVPRVGYPKGEVYLG